MKKIFTLFVATLFIMTSYAVPARLRWQTKTQPDGTTIEVQLVGDELHHYWMDREGKTVQLDDHGYWQVVDDAMQGDKAMRREAKGDEVMRREAMRREAMGSPKGIVILVNFKDVGYQAENTQATMSDMMNGDNYTYDGATGSVRKYFSDQSAGLYTPDFDVVGPVTLPYEMAHYGGNDSEGNDLLAGDMIVEACSIANALHHVDFSLYDNDKDEYVDFVYVLYAGLGEADGGEANTIWPHAYNLEDSEYLNKCSYTAEQRMFDGVAISRYACSGELTAIEQENAQYSTRRTGIGTIVHEFSHVIGLTDLYDTYYGVNETDKMTPGKWHIMDDGTYNNNGKTPPSYTLYDKYYLGWLIPENLGRSIQTLSLEAGQGYQIARSDTLVSATSLHTAYYIENRQNEGWDAHAPGHGLLIWKIMYNPLAWENNGPNSTEGTIRYALLSASGQTPHIGSAADPFPGSTNTTSWTSPMGKTLTDIRESQGIITLSYMGDVGDAPPVEREEYHIEGLQYANAMYYDSEGVKYYYFDLYAGEDTTTGEKLFPEITFTVVAQGKTAINGTYDILWGDMWRSARDMVEIEEAYPATVNIQHVDTQGNYSMKGSFVGKDGIAYYFDTVVKVSAVDLDNDLAEITLNESTLPNRVEDIHATTATTHKILYNGQLLIITHGNTYRVDGQKRD